MAFLNVVGTAAQLNAQGEEHADLLFQSGVSFFNDIAPEKAVGLDSFFTEPRALFTGVIVGDDPDFPINFPG
ncbi:MAG: hypothetical protein AAAB35_12350 [Phyllobacterium sp.]|uniref:hypothetical protein n=1 Tax=Phyllobacterium sp. TaxID=1871046 RepID=UPI0030F11310